MAKYLDEVDYKILDILQSSGRISNVDLSKRIGLSPAPTLGRVKKLEKEGLIKGYHAEVNMRMLDITVQALIQITLLHQQENQIHRFIESVQKIPEIIECYQVTGDYDYHLRVVTLDIGTLDRLITDRISKIPQVAHIKSHIILNTVKKAEVIPRLKLSDYEH